jgi:tetratricopeptide (TPR) repeat protein
MNFLDIFRSNKKDQERQAKQWAEKSLELYRNGSFDLAMLCANKSLDLKQNTGALVIKGFILNSQKNYNEAIPIWDQVLRQDKTIQLAWREKGISLLRTERYDQALEKSQQSN